MKVTTWRDYRLRKRLFWAMFLLWIPMGAGVSTTGKAIHCPWLMPAYVVYWMAARVVIGLWLAKQRCPQCSQLFFIHGPFGMGNVRARQCYHCCARPPETEV